MASTFRKWFAVATFMAALVGSLQATAPRGWHLAGSKPADYETGIDPHVRYQDAQSAFLKSNTPGFVNDGAGFGTLMQSFQAQHYLGKRVRFRGFVKSEAVWGWAGLWMRVDSGSSAVAFDNMHNRSINGTTDWQRYDVVLDVPNDATSISLGVLLTGPGAVWLSNANFEVVDSNVPITGTGRSPTPPDRPINLNFEE